MRGRPLNADSVHIRCSHRTACWSAVHGFADIAVHGPVRWQPPEVIDALGASVVECAITGVRGTETPPRS